MFNSELKQRVADLEARLNHLVTQDDGELTAYRLARALGLSEDEAEKHSNYKLERLWLEDKLVSRVSVYKANPPENDNGCLFYGSLDKAKLKLDELVARHHREECLDLDKDEQELILKRRKKERSKMWIEVRPAKRKRAKK